MALQVWLLPTIRAATDLHKRTSCWWSRQPLGSPSHFGRPLVVRLHHIRVVVLDHNRLDVERLNAFRNTSVTTSSFQRASLSIARIRVRLRHHHGTRVCSMTLSDKCATHVFRQRQNRKLLNPSACATNCRQYTHKHCTYRAVQSVHKRGKHRTRLAQELHDIFVRLKRVCHLVRTCLTLCCSRTCLVPRAHHPGHQNTQQGQHDLLQEHPVHHQPLQDLPVDKRRQKLWRENLQSGGNPRKTFSTSCEPKELATVSRVSRITDPCQFFDAQKEFGERDHRFPISEEVKEFGEIGTHGSPDSKTSETSNFQSHTHFDDSKALQILISKMESFKRC